MPYQRPNLPYVPVSLLNSNRYEVLTNTNSPVPFQALDGDNNYIIDIANGLQTQIDGVAAGIIPGGNLPGNAGLLPTTDGAGLISWIQIGQRQLAPGGVTQLAMGANSIGTPQLQNACVTTNQIADLSLTQSKYALNSVGGAQLQNNIPGSKLTDNSVTTTQIAPLTLGVPKINGVFFVYNGLTQTIILQSTNITSIVRVSQGVYTVNFLNAAGSTYFPLGVNVDPNAAQDGNSREGYIHFASATQFNFITKLNGAVTDFPYVSGGVFINA